MKKIIILGMLCTFIICGCGKDKGDTVSLTEEEYEELLKNAALAQSNEEAADAFKDIEDATGTDLPIEELTGVEEEKQKDVSPHLKYFPYPISDEIMNDSFLNGRMQIYTDVFDLNYTMTPQDVYDLLSKSDRKDLFDIEIINDEDGIPCDIRTSKVGTRGSNDLVFLFERYKKEQQLVFDDETIDVSFDSPDKNYYLVGIKEGRYGPEWPSYYVSSQDNLDTASAEIYYSGGISNGATGADGKPRDNEDIIAALDKEGYIEQPEGIVRDDAVLNAPGMYEFTHVPSYRTNFNVIKHLPEFDSYEFTYTKEKVEYIHHFSGLLTKCKFDTYATYIHPMGIGSIRIIYRGKEAIDKIETCLKERGLESKISQEINDAHIND